MLKSILEDVRTQFRIGNRITRLIVVNAAVFIAVNLVNLMFTLLTGFNPAGGFEQQFLRYIVLSSDLLFDATHPWVFITHMFVHVGFFHFLFNMLFLFWFGRIFGDFLGDHRVYPLYLLGGFVGATLYLIFTPFIGSGSMAYGASAAVMAIVAASGSIAPNYVMRLLFIGDVKLKYIVLVLILLDVFALGSMSNFGGHIAHLGGAGFGFLYVSMLKQGSDLSEPVNKVFGMILGWFTDSGSQQKTKKKSKLSVRSSNKVRGRAKSDDSRQSADMQSKIDAILDKIKATGYESLTDEEKEFLFQASKK